MKKLLVPIMFLLTIPFGLAQNNLSDAIDKNAVPAEGELREEEGINTPNRIDQNDTPAILEEREKEEEWRESYDHKEPDAQEENEGN
jgi:hypothetical protein